MGMDSSGHQHSTKIRPEIGGNDDPRFSDTSRGTNQAGVRLYNERLILSLVRKHISLAKIDIARMTGLSPQTTTVIVKRLEADGLLVRQTPIRGRVGQPAVPFSLNPEGAFAFGLKIGRKSSDLVLIDFCAQVRMKISRPHAYPSPTSVAALVSEGIAQMSATLTPAQLARVAGLGVAAPFELWNWEREVGAPRDVLDQWRHFDPQTEISRLVSMPVFLCNDATSACAAEHFFGEGWQFRDFIYVFIGSFIGGGLVLEGNLFMGRRGNAGAIGSVPMLRVDAAGVRSHQQLIRSASIFILEQRLLAIGRDPSVLWGQPSDWGDLGAVLDQWIEDVAEDLSQAILAAHAVIDCEGAVIDGAMPEAVRKSIVDRTREKIEGLDGQGLFPLLVKPGSIGPDARAIGGAALPFLANFARDREVLFRNQIQGDSAC